MPDNTWLTPYILPSSTCLSAGPSQGIVYKLDERTVLKVPFQYPVNDACPEAYDHAILSLQSFALFQKESQFHNILQQKPHPHIAQGFQCKQGQGIFLKYLDSLEEVWGSVGRDTHLVWIEQLLSALSWIEKLGYVHGDITVHNIGIDEQSQLKIFDFGSIVHRDDEGFHEHLLDDHFTLASTIHFLASGVDPLAKAESLSDLRRIENELRQGTAVIEEGARVLEQVIQAGWSRLPRTAASFSKLQEIVTNTIRHDLSCISQIRSENLSSPHSICPHSFLRDLHEEPRWMNEEDYRFTWMEKGCNLPSWT